MPFDLDSYLGVHAQALSLRTQRMTVLSENLANADTPNYKARDVDFRGVLAQAVKNAGGTLASPDGRAGATGVGAGKAGLGDRVDGGGGEAKEFPGLLGRVRAPQVEPGERHAAGERLGYGRLLRACDTLEYAGRDLVGELFEDLVEAHTTGSGPRPRFARNHWPP